MNNQFATQRLLAEMDAYDSLRSMLSELGASEDTIEMLVNAVKVGLITPSKAVEITKQTVGVQETSSVGGMVTGGPTAATATAGDGEQYFAGTRKKVKEDAPRLAGSPAKTNKQGASNLSAYKNFGFTKAPSAKEAGKKMQSIDVEELWEGNRYSQFKKEAAIRSKPQQMHEAVKMINKKLEEVSKLLEFTSQMKQELSEGEETLEYARNTHKVFEKVHKRVVEVFSKVKKLK
jgi:hypothetical protein